VEALGATSVICTDKTGTLTQNRMTVRTIYAAGQRLEDVSAPLPALRELLTTAALCNDARLLPDEESGSGRIQGDPTEAALLVVVQRSGCDLKQLAATHVRIAELPFDSDRKRMTALTKAPGADLRIHVKGSVESVLPLCSRALAQGGERPMTEAD